MYSTPASEARNAFVRGLHRANPNITREEQHRELVAYVELKREINKVLDAEMRERIARAGTYAI